LDGLEGHWQPVRSAILATAVLFVNKYFHTVGFKDNDIVPTHLQLAFNIVIESVSFNETVVASAIDKLEPKLSSEPESLPPLLFNCLKVYHVQNKIIKSLHKQIKL